MTRFVASFLLAAVVPILCGLLYFAAPMLASPQAAVFAEVDRNVERARRLLFEFGENEERLAGVLGDLERWGVSTAMDDAKINELLEQDRTILEGAEQKLRDMQRSGASLNRDLQDRYKAAGGEMAAVGGDAGFGRSVPSMARSVREGIAKRDRLLKENERILDEALGELNEGLSLGDGSASGADHPEANRLKGSVLASRAMMLHRKAQRLRQHVREPREDLMDLARRIQGLAVEQELVSASGVYDQRDEVKSYAEAIRSQLNEREADLTRLEQTVSGLKEQIEQLDQRAELTRKAMDTLEEEAKGVDANDAVAGESFSLQYEALAYEYGQALAEAHRLQFGTLDGARIEDRGDYLSGAFVPAEGSERIVERQGLVDYQNALETARADVKGLREAQAAVKDSIDELDALAQGYADRAAEATRRTDELRRSGADVAERFKSLSDEADAAFEQAATKARGAVAAYRTAARLFADEARAAGESIATESPEAQQRSAHKARSDDKSMAGQVNNELAQANYVLGSILADRYAAAADDADLVTRGSGALKFAGIDGSSFQERLGESRDTAIAAIKDARNGFERSSRDVNRHWTVAAQAGASDDLLALLENRRYTETAIADYEAAINGATLSGQGVPDYALPISDRLEQLKRRSTP